MKMKRLLSVFLIAAILISAIPTTVLAAGNVSEEEEQFLSAQVSVVSQYTQGSNATALLDIKVSETGAAKYGVIINGTKYEKMGNAYDGRYLIQLSSLQANTQYEVLPYADDLVAEEGVKFTTYAVTTTSGNTSGYYSLTPGGISYSVKNTSGTIDIQGAGRTRTTYSDAGWSVASSNSNVQLHAIPTIVTGVSGGQYIRLSYIVRNNSATPISGYKFGIHTDSMIASNDQAPVYTESYGMRVAESTASNALAFAVITKTNKAADGLGRLVTDVSTKWYGQYGQRTANVYNNGITTPLLSTDSGMACSWQNISLNPGEVKVYSAIFGIANSAVLSKVYEQLDSPTVTSKTYNSITVEVNAGQTYKIETAGQDGVLETYTASEKGTYTFTGLKGGTNYNVYTELLNQVEINFIPSNNRVVKTEVTPELKNAIEKVPSYRIEVGNETSLVAMLEQRVPSLKGCVSIESAEILDPANSEYISIVGSKITGLKITDPTKKISIRLTSVKSEFSDLWGTTGIMDDIIIRVRVTTSLNPYITKDGAVIKSASGLEHGLKSVNYSYTGDTKQEYKSWYTFVMTYEMDGKKKEIPRYVFIETDFDQIEVTSNGFKISYLDALIAGSFAEYGYQYVGNTEPDLMAEGFSFTPDYINKNSFSRTNEGGKFEFVVSRGGWYVLKVKDSVFGTEYYKVQVTEPAEKPFVSGESYPVLQIVNDQIIGLIDGGDIKYVRFNEDTLFTEGFALIALEPIVYKVQLIDNNGCLYSLTADMRAMNPKDQIDVSGLEVAISEAGVYVSLHDHTTFNSVIAEAEAVKEAPQTQAQILATTKSLKAAIAAYKSSAKVIVNQLVTTTDNKVTIKPVDDMNRLAKVTYNVNEGKMLVPMVWKSWAGMSGAPYAKAETFTDNQLVFENLTNGIYTFLISVEESGTKKEYVQYAIVRVASTEQEVGNQELMKAIAEAQEFINNTIKESNAEIGALCLADALYNKVVAEIAKAGTMVNGDVYNSIIPEVVILKSLLTSAQKGIGEKQPPTEPEAKVPAVITENGVTAELTSPSIKKVLVSYGQHKTWVAFNTAGYSTLKLTSGTYAFAGKYNGQHTALISYLDGSEEYRYFNISGIEYPFTLTDNGGEIRIVHNDLTSVASVSYGFGDAYTNITSKGLILTGNKESLQAMGNGIHTVFVKMVNGEVYMQTILVTSCTNPVIMKLDGKTAAFTNGFDIKFVAYAQGEYSVWSMGTEETNMYQKASYISTNTWLDLSSITGTYRFYFYGNDGSEYFKVVELN